MALMGCLGCEGTYEIGSPQCPHCGTRSPMYTSSEEEQMPTITSGGASNAGEQAEDEAAPAVEVPAEVSAEAESVPAAVEPEQPSNLALVGEPGPELVNLPAGDTVTPEATEAEPAPVEQPEEPVAAAEDVQPDDAAEPEAEPQP